MTFYIIGYLFGAIIVTLVTFYDRTVYRNFSKKEYIIAPLIGIFWPIVTIVVLFLSVSSFVIAILKK